MRANIVLFLATLMVSSTLAAFKLTGVSQELRDYYCFLNTNYCNEVCNQSPQVNTCDTTSMDFDCICKYGYPNTNENGVPYNVYASPRINRHFFPVNFYQCQGELQECFNGCVPAGSTQESIATCKTNCENKFACGTANAGETINYWTSDRAGLIDGSGTMTGKNVNGVNTSTSKTNSTSTTNTGSINAGTSSQPAAFWSMILVGVVAYFA